MGACGGSTAEPLGVDEAHSMMRRRKLRELCAAEAGQGLAIQIKESRLACVVSDLGSPMGMSRIKSKLSDSIECLSPKNWRRRSNDGSSCPLSPKDTPKHQMDSAVFMSTPDSDFIVQVQLPYGSVISVMARQESSVQYVKEEVADQTGMSREQMDDMVLTNWGVRMQEGLQLNSYDIPWNGTRLVMEVPVVHPALQFTAATKMKRIESPFGYDHPGLMDECQDQAVVSMRQPL